MTISKLSYQTIVLRDCSISKIKDAVKTVTTLPSDILGKKALDSLAFARRFHTRENFANEFRDVVLEIITASQKNKEEAI